jgi:xanthine dehydrogenase YagT iron-sulfur-binding subunit
MRSAAAETRPLAVSLNVNGVAHELWLDPRVTLLDAVRDHLGLTGTKKGCDHGLCGACTVHVDGQARVSCLMLAVAAAGRRIDTIEGLAAADGTLHPLQQAFIDHDAFQCGYCTPGQIMSALGAIASGQITGPSDIEAWTHNLCRCGAYDNIRAAIASVLKTPP